MSSIFSGIQIKNKKIRNRIAFPPMVCFGWTGEDGFVTDDSVRHYEERAKGGTGLIIVEATCISKEGRLADTQLGIWSDEHINGLKRIAGACHRHDAVVLIQIHHAGFKAPEGVSNIPLAPSDYTDNHGRTARAVTVDEIHEIQKAFADAAIRAEKAGFDGIELHGAHGYLISQFMSPVINKRRDAYGGNIENRMRFGLEIIDLIKRSVSKDFIIGYRMGANEPTLEEGIRIAQALEERGIDLLHVSAGIGGDSLPEVPEGFQYNWIVYSGTKIKENVSIPVIAVNGIRTLQQAEFLVENQLADFAAVGRAMLVDPDWANKAVENADIKPCLNCARCAWSKDGKYCPGRNR